MTTALIRPAATVTVVGKTVDADEGTATLDSMSVPYATARVTVPLIDIDIVEDIDPRDTLRAQLTGINEVTARSRTFDLGVRTRTVDHKQKTLTLELAGDEALLMAYAPLSDDTGARAYETSLRGICNYVLGKVLPGTSLAASPSPDANVSPVWSTTNYVPNPRIATDLTGWSAAGPATVTRVAASANPAGLTTAARATWSSSALWGVGMSSTDPSQMVSVSGATTVTVSAYARSSVSRDLSLRVQWYENSGGTLTLLDTTYVIGTITSAWARLSGTTVSPNRATHARIMVVATTTGTTGAYFDATGFMLTKEAWLTDYFDGATTATSTYVYRWNGTAANAAGAASERVCLIDERTPDAFRWEPGTSAWDFLQPFTATAGLRLFCDENRVWRLVDPAAYFAPGRLAASPASSTEGTDRISLDDADVYCTGVVIRYTWKDSAAVQRVKTDAAGSPGRVRVIDLARPYPGAGVAAAVLARMTGQGRTQEVVVLTDWTATPSQQVSISLPGTVDQIGQVDALEWSLTSGLMRVRTRALTDILPGSVNALPGTINALTGTINALT